MPPSSLRLWRLTPGLLLFSLLNISPAFAIPDVPDPCASYADQFHGVVDQIKRFNGNALAYTMQREVELNRLRYYRQMVKKLDSIISCLEDNDNDVLDYYNEIKGLTLIQIEELSH